MWGNLSQLGTTIHLRGDDSGFKKSLREVETGANATFARMATAAKSKFDGALKLKETFSAGVGLVGSALAGFGVGALAGQLSSLHAEAARAAAEARAAVEAELARREAITREVRATASELRGLAWEQTGLEQQLRRINDLYRAALVKVGELNRGPRPAFAEYGGSGVLGTIAGLVPDLSGLFSGENSPGASIETLNRLRAGIEETTGRGRLLAQRALIAELNEAAEAARRAAVEQTAEAEARTAREARIAALRARGFESSAALAAETERHLRRVEALERSRGDLSAELYEQSKTAEAELHESTKARILAEEAGRIAQARERREAAAQSEAERREARLRAYDARTGGGAMPEARFGAGQSGLITAVAQRVGLGSAADGAARMHAESLRSRREQTEAIRRVEQAVREQRGAVGRFA